MKLIERYRGSLLGLAVGDALGTTVEFRPPGSFTPINDIVGGGPFGLKPGEWTDDTSMALCLAAENRRGPLAGHLVLPLADFAAPTATCRNGWRKIDGSVMVRGEGA